MFRRLLIAVAALTPAVASAASWDWTQEFSSRHWRTATLAWAQDIHPDHPSFADLQELYEPPAHEIWCANETTPTGAEIQEFNTRLNDWKRDFLGIPAGQAIPALPAFPQECAR